MKKLLLIIAAVAIFNAVFCKEKKDSIGYFVYVEKCGEVAEMKTESLAEAEKFIHSFYPDFCANIQYIFEQSSYYRENCFRREIYCEKMRITKSGKYKRIKNFTK